MLKEKVRSELVQQVRRALPSELALCVAQALEQPGVEISEKQLAAVEAQLRAHLQLAQMSPKSKGRLNMIQRAPRIAYAEPPWISPSGEKRTRPSDLLKERIQLESELVAPLA
ncbi:MAG: hypothetical protein SGPRY_007588 [Prymnesium sp.]